MALRAHLLHGARYRSLALVDVVALAPWGSEFFRLVGENADVFAQLPPSLHEALVRAYITGAAHRPLRAPDLDMLTAPWLGDPGRAAFYRHIAQADQRYTDEIEPLYPTLDLPVQVVWGTEDTWIPVDRAHRLAALIPGARLALVPDAGTSSSSTAGTPHGRAGAWLGGGRLGVAGFDLVAVSDERSAAVGLAPLLTVCCGYFMVILDVTIVNVAAPAIGRDLGASLTDLQWIVDGYTVAFAGLLLFGGALGDRWGHRRVFCLGVSCSPPRPSAAPSRGAPSRSRRSGCSRAAAPPCWCRARWPCCSRSTAHHRPGPGPSGYGVRSRVWRPPRARSWAVC